MPRKKEQQSIPSQHIGKKLDLQSKASFDNEIKAEEFYRTAKRRLLRAFEWYHIAKIPASTFKLTDQHGNEILREMHENDIICIDIPGPGTKQGDGYDWVRVEKIVEDRTVTGEYCAITLRPTSNPQHEDEAEVAHFFKSMATSTILIKRQNADVIAQYSGRNELVNTDTSKLTDKIRNLVVGLAAKLGMSYSQWKSLIEGIVDKKKEDKL